MLNALRKRMTYANIAMTLALVFAMTGGAYAAKKYLITSTKQISPSVLKQLAGKPGPAGKDGVPGALGPQGPAGPAGKDGTPGKDGLAGKEGPAGKEGKEGKTGKEGPQGTQGQPGEKGSPWTAGGTLPENSTETGVWAGNPAQADQAETSGGAAIPITFAVPLANELEASQVHFIPMGETAPAACEDPNHAGAASVDNPEALSGQLCVYGGLVFNAITPTDTSIQKPSLVAGPGAGVSGAVISVIYKQLIGLGSSGEEYPGIASGTFAVTG